MIKKRFLWLLLFAALVMSGSAVFAQAPKGPEKAMIYNGESLKVQLTGDIRLNMVQNQKNVSGDTYALWVNNQKWGAPLFALGAPIFPFTNTYGVWMPYPATLTNGSLIFDARYSQIGLTVSGPGVLGGTSFARFEMDFYGGFGTVSGNVSRQPVLRLRNAYAGLAWQKDMFGAKVTFGQYTSLVTPVLAYPVGLSPLPFFFKGVPFDWDQGIMLSFTIGTPKVNVMIDIDMARAKAGNDTAGTLYPGEGPGSGVNDERGNGEASMHPAWHGRIAFNLNPDPIFGLMVAVTGHYYTERATLAHANTATWGLTIPAFFPVQTADVPSKSAGLQAKVSVWIFTIQGSGWLGENMDNFTAGFLSGYRESISGMKNLADKGRGGYAGLYIVGPKVGIPIVLFAQMGQELKHNSKRIPRSTTAGAYSLAVYALSTIGGATSTILANSEISGGLWLYIPGTPMRVGYEVGQVVTKFKGVSGTSTSMVHRMTASYSF